VETARCPACGAALADGAQWCTLCFADLRPPVLEPEPVSVGAVALAAAAPAVPPAPAAAPLPPHPILDAPVSKPADVRLAAPSWPCQECGRAVAIDLTECDGCGTAFLGGSTVDISLHVPGVGDLASLSSGRRIGFMAGGALLLMLVLVVVYLVLGSL
jgi:hypothetical protein